MEVRAIILAAVLVALVLGCSGCANRRYYIGVDDYGETTHYHQEHDAGSIGERENRR
jgi:hypothetical protein